MGIFERIPEGISREIACRVPVEIPGRIHKTIPEGIRGGIFEENSGLWFVSDKLINKIRGRLFKGIP